MPIRALEMCVTFTMQHMIDQFHESEQFFTLFQNLSNAYFDSKFKKTPFILYIKSFTLKSFTLKKSNEHGR
jgi:hypothetical protein